MEFLIIFTLWDKQIFFSYGYELSIYEIKKNWRNPFKFEIKKYWKSVRDTSWLKKATDIPEMSSSK